MFDIVFTYSTRRMAFPILARFRNRFAKKGPNSEDIPLLFLHPRRPGFQRKKREFAHFTDPDRWISGKLELPHIARTNKWAIHIRTS